MPLYSKQFPVDEPHKFWIPRIAMFTGARLNEICSLYLEDIHEVDGVLCFDINTNHEDRKVKTETSERTIPVHPTLIEIGILRYVEAMKKEGHQRLFPQLSYDKSNHYGGALGKWWGKYSRLHVTKDKQKVFHSFRRDVADELKQNGVDRGVIEELLGHKDQSMSTGYPQHPSTGTENRDPIFALHMKGIE
jgi:integrase